MRVALVLLSLLMASSARADQPGNVILDSSEQVFSVLAALNVAGYDTGEGIVTGNDTRDQVRRVLGKKNLAVLPELRKFYAGHRVAGDAGADLGQFISLALFLGPPPDFKLTVPQNDLPPDARQLVGFIPLLRRFYVEASLLDLWARVQPRVHAEIERYSDAVRRTITLSDAYFRFPSGAYLGRTYTIDLDLLGAPEQVQARIYGLNYSLVVTPSRAPKLSEIRHQYLHFLVDPLAVKFAPEIQQKASLKAVALQAPALGTDFKEDFSLLLTECLIRAAELRMDKRPKAEAQKAVTEMTASGLVLVPYFYDALQDYERQDASLSVYYKPMVLGMDPGDERKRLAGVKFIEPAAPAVESSSETNSSPQGATEEELLLNEGDNLIYHGRYAQAKTAFQSVLERLNPKSPRALFGLAVVASNTRKPDVAEEYFQKTLEAAKDLRLVTWSHIYLGRLYDIEGKRGKALEQYRTASLTAGAYPEASRAVQDGLSRPFGSKP